MLLSCNEIAPSNLDWSEQIIDDLAHLGIRHFVIAPGSRSTPLYAAISAHPLITTTIHFQESTCAFVALGIAKATMQPVAVVTTSGSALAHLLPAVMEAFYQNIPLVLLTADRPGYLQEIGANQTCNQKNIFSSFVAASCFLESPATGLKSYLKSTLCHAIHLCQRSSQPIHINIPFEKPLLQHSDRFLTKKNPIEYFFPKHFDTEEMEFLASLLSCYDKGVLIVSECMISSSTIDSIFRLSDHLQWPIFSDLLSPIRPHPHSNIVYGHPAIIEQNNLEEFTIDAVCHFGKAMIHEGLLAHLQKKPPKFYLHISNHLQRQDSHFLITHAVKGSIDSFTNQILDYLPKKNNPDFMKWRFLSQMTEVSLKKRLALDDSLHETTAMHLLFSHLNEEDLIFIGNSCPIRAADLLYFPKTKAPMMFANRGLSGIDGNIATAIGMSLATQKRLIMLVGDLTFLYDHHALELLEKLPLPPLFIVFNNHGGGIFHRLPETQNFPSISSMTVTPHKKSIKEYASLYQMNYFQFDNLKELQSNLEVFFAHRSATLVELCFDGKESYKKDRRLYQIH